MKNSLFKRTSHPDSNDVEVNTLKLKSILWRQTAYFGETRPIPNIYLIADIPYNINLADWDNGFDLEKLVPLLYNILDHNGNLIIFNGWSNVCKTKSLLDSHFILQDWIIYDRIKGRGGKKHLVSTREDILWYTKTNEYTFNKIPSIIKKKTGGLGLKKWV